MDGEAADQGPGLFELARDYLFGKQLTPEEQVKQWKDHLTEQKRILQRQLRAIAREETKVKNEIKKLANKNDMDNATILTRELLRSRKQVVRIHTSIAQLNSVQMQLQQNLATYKIAGAMKRSADIMKVMNNMVKVPELRQNMMIMAQEMQKAGLIDEIIDESLALGDSDSLSEEVEEAVSKVFEELNLKISESAPTVGKTRARAASDQSVSPAKRVEDHGFS